MPGPTKFMKPGCLGRVLHVGALRGCLVVHQGTVSTPWTASSDRLQDTCVPALALAWVYWPMWASSWMSLSFPLPTLLELRTCHVLQKMEKCFGGWKWTKASVVKNLPDHAGDARDTGLIPGSGRSPREGNDNLLQYSSLENLIGRGAEGCSPWGHRVGDDWATEHLSKTQSLFRGSLFKLNVSEAQFFHR